MGLKYLVLGAGRQGTAAAYDLSKFGDAEKIAIADLDLVQAKHSAERVNGLVAGPSVEPEVLDVRDFEACKTRFEDVDVVLSAVPYIFNLQLTRAAIAAHCSLCDLGGNTDVVMGQLALDAEATANGSAIVPDCGVGPGLISNLAVFAMEKLEHADEVRIWDGGLPANPKPPFNYKLFFNAGGLVNEYCGDALYLRDGRITKVLALDPAEYQLLEIPELGNLEAFTTSGALSTMAQTYKGKLKVLENRTLRYPGHFGLLQSLAELGMFADGEVAFEGTQSSGRAVAEKLFSEAFRPDPDEQDLMVVRIEAKGVSDGRQTTATLDMLDRFDVGTGFAAMERTTGFHLAVVAEMIARGEVKPGAHPLEQAVSSGRIVEAMGQRGIGVNIEVA